VTATPDLGKLQPRLTRLLAKAKECKEKAEAACSEPRLRRTKGFLGRATKKTQGIIRILRSRRARQTFPEPLRDQLLDDAEGVRRDLLALRKALDCPGSVLDTDQDGVPDETDACPGTPPGEPVDASGCAAG